MKVETLDRSNAGILRIITASLIAVVASFGLILLFALMIKWFGWSDGVITPVNIAIKIVSIAIGVLVATKNSNKVVYVGMIVGMLYIAISFVVFSAFLGSFSLSLNNLWDLCLGAVSGALVGVISNIIHK